MIPGLITDLLQSPSADLSLFRDYQTVASLQESGLDYTALSSKANLDSIDLLALKSQGRVCTLFW